MANLRDTVKDYRDELMDSIPFMQKYGGKNSQRVTAFYKQKAVACFFSFK